MYAFKLIELIDNRAERLAHGLMHRLKKNDRCSELPQRVSSDELTRGSHEIYADLSDWLLHRPESELEKRYVALGIIRAAQGVPYTEFMWAVTTTKESLWLFMLEEGLFDEPIKPFGEILAPLHGSIL